MIVEKINEFLTKEKKTLDEGFKYLLKQEFSQLSGFSFEHQFLSDRKESDGELRFSSCGKCPRQLGYAYHKEEKNGKEIDSRGLRTFFIGDMTETMLVLLAKVSGVAIFGYGLQQPKISFKIGDKEIFGHPDGFIIHENKVLVVEFKSMSSFSYAEFEKGNIEESYVFQANANMYASGLDSLVFVAFNKDNSMLSEKLIQRDEKIIEKIKENLTAVLNSTPLSLPDRAFEPNEKGFLPWNCAYCPYWQTCWKNASKVLVGKSYKLKVDMAKEFELSSMGKTNE